MASIEVGGMLYNLDDIDQCIDLIKMELNEAGTLTRYQKKLVFGGDNSYVRGKPREGVSTVSTEHQPGNEEGQESPL